MSMAPQPEQLPIAYALAGSRRPGWLTAVAVIWIVLASLAIFANLILVTQALAMHAFSAFANTMRATTGPQTPTAVVQSTRMLTEQEVARAVEGLSRLQQLSPGHIANLQALLRDPAQRFFAQGTQLQPRWADALVQSHGALEDDGVYFTLHSGDLRLWADRAEFRTSGGDRCLATGGQLVTGGGRALTTAQIETALADVRSQVGTISDQQLAGLRAELASPFQPWVPTPAEVQRPWLSASLDPDGVLMVANPSGGVLAWYGPNGARTVPGIFGPAGTGNPQPHRHALSLVMAEALLSVGLAVYLIVACSLALRQRPSARTHLLAWSLAKVLLSAAAVPLWWWMATGVEGSVWMQTGRSVHSSTYFSFTTAVVALGVLPALGMLVCLFTPAVRAYFRPVPMLQAAPVAR